MTSSIESNKKRKARNGFEGEKPYEELETENEQLKSENAQLNQKLADMEAHIKVSSDEDDEDVSDLSDTEEVTNTWTVQYRMLREHRIVNGDFSIADPKLKKWAAYQKFCYANVKNGKVGAKISQERIQKLDAIGFDWGKKFPPPKTFEEGLAELQKYQKAMGHCNIAIDAQNPSPLAKFVLAQRSEYKRFRKGTGSLLTLEQIGQLKAVGFKWKSTRK